MMDLFPETKGEQPAPIKYTTQGVQDKWDYERVEVRLVPRWEPSTGLWLVGWLAKADGALDEWIAGRVPANWPWYRLDETPQSRSLDMANAVAARGVKIVLEQMKQYVDRDLWPHVTGIQERLEADARRWLMGADA
jgi:hypothetical protein